MLIFFLHIKNILGFHCVSKIPILFTACYLFTKITRPLVYFWHAQGIVSFVYIDDGLIIKDSLIQCGFVPSKTKFLGLIINSDSMTFSVPPAKVIKLLHSIDAILSAQRSSIPSTFRSLAGVAGQIISMSLAIGPVSRLMTRAIYRSIESRESWSDSVLLSNNVISELNFWRKLIRSMVFL